MVVGFRWALRVAFRHLGNCAALLPPRTHILPFSLPAVFHVCRCVSPPPGPARLLSCRSTACGLAAQPCLVGRSFLNSLCPIAWFDYLVSIPVLPDCGLPLPAACFQRSSSFPSPYSAPLLRLLIFTTLLLCLLPNFLVFSQAVILYSP